MTQVTIPAYVYYIEHTPTGKFYYGSRYKHTDKNLLPADDLWVNYFSSSKEVAKLIKETGKESFSYKILLEDSDKELCFKFEQDLIKDNIGNPLCLNKRYFDSAKGNSVFCIAGKTLSSKGKPKSEKTKQNMRKPKSLEHRENMRKAQLLNGGNGPRQHKQESKDKTRETMKRKPSRPDVVCPHCGQEGGAISMHRWHFDNCKVKQ